MRRRKTDKGEERSKQQRQRNPVSLFQPVCKDRETESGRPEPEPELSWGNCVHETGVLHELKGSHVKKVMKGPRSSNAF
jgi:hypothetical protein